MGETIVVTSGKGDGRCDVNQALIQGKRLKELYFRLLLGAGGW